MHSSAGAMKSQSGINPTYQYVIIYKYAQLLTGFVCPIPRPRMYHTLIPRLRINSFIRASMPLTEIANNKSEFISPTLSAGVTPTISR